MTTGDSQLIYRLACFCGAQVTVNSNSVSGTMKCSWCGAAFRIEVLVDPRTGRRVAVPVAANTPPRKAKTVRVPVVQPPPAPAAPPPRQAKTQKVNVPQVPVPGELPLVPSGWTYLPARLMKDMYGVTCTCGVLIRVHPGALDKVQKCDVCGAAFKAMPAPTYKKSEETHVISPAAAKRQKTQKVPVPPEIAPAPAKKPKTQKVQVPAEIRPPAIPKQPQAGAYDLVLESGTYKLPCFCGAENRINPASLGEVQTCFWCHGRFRIVVAQNPDTGKEFAITMPVSAAEAGTAVSPPTPAPAPPPRPIGKGPTREVPASVSGPGKSIASTVVVRCFCGARLYARRDQVGCNVVCPACERLLKLETVRDPQTLGTTVRAELALASDPSAEVLKRAP
jgi:hypothetical protein